MSAVKLNGGGRIKQTTAFIAFMTFLVSPASAQADFDLGGGDIARLKEALSGFDVPRVSAPAPARGRFSGMNNPGPRAPKEWTVMVYMNGKSDLEPNAVRDLNEMEMAGSSAGINIVAELGRIDGHDSSNGDWRGSRIYYVTRDDDPEKINSPAVAENRNADMGSWRHLAEFVEFARGKYPAEKYMLIIWNHGSGWQSYGKPIEGYKNLSKGVSYDDETGNHITAVELRRAFERTGKIEVVAFDACLMADTAVFYEIRDYADVIVASEELEPTDGYDFTALMKRFAENPAANSEEMGKHIVDAFMSAYPGPENIGRAAHSAIRAAQIAPLAGLLDDFARLALASSDIETLKALCREMPFLGTYISVDMHLFMAEAAKRVKDEKLAAKACQIMSFITDRAVILNRENLLQDVKGIAVYIPYGAYEKNFSQLSIAKDTAWDELMFKISDPDFYGE